MKKVIALMPVLAAGSLFAQISQPPIPEGPSGTMFLLERGAHHNVMGLVETNHLDSGEAIVSTNRLVQVATGLNYLGKGNAFEPAVPEFELVEGGAIAWRGQHKVTLAWNVNVADAVQLRLPDGQLLTSQLHGLAYYDTASGQAVLVATLKDSQGVLVAPSQVLFPDAFSGIAADVRYTYTLAGFEQDIILREAPPSPETFGLSPATTRLEVWSEFPQTPAGVATFRPASGSTRREEMAEAEQPLMDETVDFGSLQLGTGRAFAVENADEPIAIVAKQWVRTEEGRSFLVETVAVSELKSSLNSLPASSGGALVKPRPGAPRLQALRSLPAKARTTASKGRIRRPESEKLVALAGRPGLVLDWVGLNTSQSDYVFKGNETYWITGPVNLNGTSTTFEGGTVIKFTNNVTGLKLTVNTPLKWEGSPYRPVVLTAQDDHSVGQKIGNAAPPASGSYYATVALSLDATAASISNFQLAHARIAFAKTAVEIKQKNGHTISHIQVVNCETGIAPTAIDFSVRNGLMHNLVTAFGGSGSTIRGEHLTVDGAANLFTGSFNQLYLTNSLVVDTSNVGGFFGHAVAVGGSQGVFETVLAGAHYLSAGSTFRDAGTGQIHPDLAADLAGMTTYAPLLLTNGFAVKTVLQPLVPRDADQPDLGYHYPVLDYVWTLLTANNVELVLTNGVAVAGYGPRLLTLSGTGKLTSVGLPQQLNRLVTYNAVQEQPQTWITNATYTAINGGNIALRFTDASFMAASTGGRYLVPGGAFNHTINIQDSSLRGAYWYFYNYSGGGLYFAGINLRNTLLDRCFLHLEQGYAGTPYYLPLTIHNCLFSRTTVEWLRSTTYYGSWNIHDNLFDNATLSVWYFTPSDPINVAGYNGFINTSNPLGGSGNKTGLDRDFVKGPLGDYYYPATGGANSLATLVNADNTRTAGVLGLFHHGTTADQAKDTGNLDIGFHYMALQKSLASSAFGPAQGGGGWRYQSSPALGTTVANLTTFGIPAWNTENTHYNASWAGTADQYTGIWDNSQHPGWNYDSVRSWQAPASGIVTVFSYARNYAACGSDGVQTRILRNGSVVEPWRDVPGNNTDVVINLRTPVLGGDVLAFQLNKKSSAACDASIWDPLVIWNAPNDQDADGLADYWEDADGNGLYNSSTETRHDDADTDDDGLNDAEELSQGRNPRTADATLLLFTPSLRLP